MFTESTSPTQAYLQIAPALAVILALLIGVTGAALGAFVAWWVNGREMRRTRHELSEVRSVRESALTVRRQALEERDRTAQEFTQAQTEAQALRRQLDQAQAVARAAETQLEELKATVRASRRQVEESRNELLTMEEQWDGKNQMITRLQAQVRDLQTALDDARKQLNERYLTITALKVQIEEYRVRASESHNVVTSLQTAFAELSRRLQQQSLRMTETDVRANDVQARSTIAAETPLPLPPQRAQASDADPSETLQTPPAVRRQSPPPNPLNSNNQDELTALENQLIAMLEELKK
jgi:uncharacterized protein (DUF3084 family)